MRQAGDQAAAAYCTSTNVSRARRVRSPDDLPSGERGAGSPDALAVRASGARGAMTRAWHVWTSPCQVDDSHRAAAQTGRIDAVSSVRRLSTRSVKHVASTAPIDRRCTVSTMPCATIRECEPHRRAHSVASMRRLRTSWRPDVPPRPVVDAVDDAALSCNCACRSSDRRWADARDAPVNGCAAAQAARAIESFEMARA